MIAMHPDRTMRPLKLTILAPVLVVAMLKLVAAQDIKGDAAAGRQFAETWCSGCHAVEHKTTRSGIVAPDFASVANRRSTNARRLIRFLYSQHRKMPNFEIELDDAANVAAHIMSLKRR